MVIAPGHESLLANIKDIRNQFGGVLGSFEAWLLLRGMRTLAIRVKTACSNAIAIARFLETQSGVKKVLYCGLKTHAGHEIARRQMQDGFGAMLSLDRKSVV